MLILEGDTQAKGSECPVQHCQVKLDGGIEIAEAEAGEDAVDGVAGMGDNIKACGVLRQWELFGAGI